MRRSSLRLRLLLGAVAAIFVALALAGAGISWLFHRHVERREVDALVLVGRQVAAALTADRSGRWIVSPAPADPEFQAIAGGSYWQVSGSGGSAQSPSLWDQSLAGGKADRAEWSSTVTAGPFEPQVIMVSRVITPMAGGPPATIRVARVDTAMRAAIAEFDRELAAGLAMLWIVLVLAAYVQVHLGLRPLGRVEAELGRLRRSPAARLSVDHPTEIGTLITAINALAAAREADLGRARRRAADLAHSLKTPLTVLSAQSRRARDAGAHEAANGLDRAIAAVNSALEAELARSRASAMRGSAPAERAAPEPIAEQLINVLERTPHGEKIVFQADIDPELTVPVAPPDLAEILGALMENAARHARRQVLVVSQSDGMSICLRVEDDGSGMDDVQARNVMARGVRLDETGSGHGLGLSIVRDLAEATEGTLELGRSGLGGLAARLTWPARPD